MNILVINSIPDFITKLREESQSKSPRLSKFNIFHTYIIKDNKFPTVKELFDRFNSEIDRTHPEIILVHIGLGFRRHRFEMTDVLKKIKERNNKIKIVVEEILEKDGLILDFCDYSIEMKNLINLFFL
jgi:hypothetical protein